ncbi:YbjP/YqhG family protein [Prosthecodimorpha staleyi]|uniref:YbjP/YqhG family protein n=1 Tax=Prosthecodimorpha staleyi TaxID=2840188 RepID=A0A947D6T7_9HYPH|nr:YbjP/YqhG family protein [Prosthecodimorpha staleyi]MBT9291991.1 YbjP/YqhG family protein [Prosthecodimorpha staleyi]
MHRRAFLLLASASLVAAPALAAAKKPVPAPAPASAKPEDVVRNLYARLDAEAYDYMTNRKLAQRYFTASTVKLIDKVDAKSKKLQEPGIDYDPLIDGQDGEVKGLAVTVESATADRATVVAAFTSFDEKLRVTFDMQLEKGAWRVEDIRGREGSSLKAVAADYLKD